MEKKPVMYIFINEDLKMSLGKAIAQCCHIVYLITEDIVRKGYEVFPVTETYITFMKWKQECTKIVLKATTDQLKELMKIRGAYHFIDSGIRGLPDNSLTVVGFAPSTDLDEIAKDYKLY